MKRWAREALLALVLAMSARPAGADVLDEIRVGGQIDLAYADNRTAVQLNTLNAGGSAFDAYRLRLFFEGTPLERLDIFTQLFYSEISGTVVYSAYASYAPFAGRDLHLLGGKIPWIIGTYGPRTYADKNPLIAAPLMWQYHTTLPFYSIVPSADALLSQAGNGQFGIFYYPGDPGWKGMPMIYDFCWDVGIAVTGSEAPFEYAIGVINGTPSVPNAGRDDNHGKSFLGRVGVQPTPNVRFGVSGSTGPYLPSFLDPTLGGAKAEDFDQNLAMADLEILYGRAELHAEALFNRYEAPNVGDLDTRGWYVEGRYALPMGLYLAARYNTLDFDDIEDSAGNSRSWDSDVDRLDAGVGYRFARGVIAKVEHQSNWLRHEDARGTRRYDVVGGQVTVKF